MYADPLSPGCLQARAELWLPLRCYNLGAYLAYLFYPPLYIAGPTITFNSFASQLEARAHITRAQVGGAGIPHAA
jgi:D-alanyl-lipoteichoic acid acyltransferase DltB (MBOAT superfamily)